MEIAVTKLAIICFFVIGVSHILQPRVWAQFFIDMRDKGEVGSLLNALLHFPLGAGFVVAGLFSVGISCLLLYSLFHR